MSSLLSVPTVHLNGTSKNELLRQLSDAITAIEDAGKRLAAACPHGRDYYVQPGDAIEQALNDHYSRMRRLTSVVKELEDIAIAIDSQ